MTAHHTLPSESKSTRDTTFVVLGAAFALLSAGFAAYMMTQTDRKPAINGSQHLMIYARPTGIKRERLDRQLAKLPAGLSHSSPDDDLLATGSVPKKLETAPVDPPAKPAPPKKNHSYIAAKRDIGIYKIRDIFDGKALLYGPAGFLLTSPGNDLANAGTVEEIAFHEGKWIVITTEGIIRSQFE